MQFILPLLYLCLFILLIVKWNFFENPFLSRIKLVFLFLLKLGALASVWLVYTYHYAEADFFTYFRDSSVFVHNLFNSTKESYSTAWTGSFEDPVFNSSRFMIVLNGVLHIFSFGNFYVHGIFFCFFSFMGLTALLKAFSIHYPSKKGVLIALFFIPSILFWGSAPLKEAIAIGATGMIIFLTDFGLKKSYSKKDQLVTALMVLLLLFSKVHVLLALIPVLTVNMIVARSSEKKLFLKYLGVFTLMGGLLFLLASVSPDLNVLRIISDKQAKAISEAKGGIFMASSDRFVAMDHAGGKDLLELQPDGRYLIKDGSSYLSWKQNNMADTTFVTDSKDTALYTILYITSPANTAISMKKLKPEPLDFIIHSPVAFLNVLIRPTFLQIHSWLHLLAAVENCWILVLIILSVWLFDKKALEEKPVLFFCITFGFIIFILIGFITPAMGAMVRYKTIGLLFLAAACLIMLDEEKLRKKILRKKEL